MHALDDNLLSIVSDALISHWEEQEKDRVFIKQPVKKKTKF